MMAIKRIMIYMKGIEDYGLYYKRSDRFELKVFNDSNWVGNIDDRKNASGGAFFLRNRLVSWRKKKHKCISQSIVEVKYVEVMVNYSNTMWIKQLLKGMLEEIIDLVHIYCDNASAINILKNPVMHNKTKHIAIKYHYLRELVQYKEVKL